MPVEIDLIKINANGLGKVLKANLTNLFGISNDDFLSFKQEKKLATHIFCYRKQKKKLGKGE